MARKSTLSNLVLTLGAIAGIAALGLGGMNVLTSEPIAQSKQARVTAALKEVLPDFDNDPSSDTHSVELDGEELRLYTARMGDQKVGTAVESFSPNGFSGMIRVMVGFDAAGAITGYSVLQHAETPGLGDRMVDWFLPAAEPVRSLVERVFGFTMPVVERKSNVLGMNPSGPGLTVSKDGGQIDAITAATITSRAFLDAVNRAHRALETPTGDAGNSNEGVAVESQAGQADSIRQEPAELEQK